MQQRGGEIIKETFKSMSDEEYEKIAYQVKSGSKCNDALKSHFNDDETGRS